MNCISYLINTLQMSHINALAEWYGKSNIQYSYKNTV
jgi:hypothetical protein